MAQWIRLARCNPLHALTSAGLHCISQPRTPCASGSGGAGSAWGPNGQAPKETLEGLQVQQPGQAHACVGRAPWGKMPTPVGVMGTAQGMTARPVAKICTAAQVCWMGSLKTGEKKVGAPMDTCARSQGMLWSC